MKRRGRAARALAAALVLAAAPSPASAHVAIEGAGAFTAGLLHPVFVLNHLLALLGLGLLLAQRDLAHTRAALPAFVAALLAGFAWGALGPALSFDPSRPLLGAAFIAGVLVAWAGALPRLASAALAAVIGFVVAIDSIPDEASPWALTLALAGTALAVSLLLVNVVALASQARRPWQRIGVRVVGSWIGACSLMVAALVLR